MRKFAKKIFWVALILSQAIFLSAYDRPIVSDISATYAKGTKVNVLWTLPENPQKPITRILVYRTSQPISSYKNIENEQPIAELAPSATGYTDSLSDFSDYFYTIICVTTEPYTLVMPAMNSTVSGVHVATAPKKSSAKKSEKKDKSYPSGTIRETPLPYLDIIEGLEKPESPFSEEAVNSSKSLGLKPIKKNSEMTPYFFEEDLILPESGDAYFLFEILSKRFVQNDYENAKSELLRLIGTNASKDVLDRAYFYLGEAYYFTGDFENAVRAFIKVQQVFPVQTKKWIESSLDNMEIS